MELREKCCDHLLTHYERFQYYHTDIQIREHAAQLRRGGQGLIADLQALEEILDRNIAVYSIDAQDPTKPLYLSELLPRVAPVTLSYHGMSQYHSIYDTKLTLPRKTIRPSQDILAQRIKAFDPSAPVPTVKHDTGLSKATKSSRRMGVFNTQPDTRLFIRTHSPFRNRSADTLAESNDMNDPNDPLIIYRFARSSSVVFANAVKARYDREHSMGQVLPPFEIYHQRASVDRGKENLRYLREMYRALGGKADLDRQALHRRNALIEAEAQRGADKQVVRKALDGVRVDLKVSVFAEAVLQLVRQQRETQREIALGDLELVVMEAQRREDELLASRLPLSYERRFSEMMGRDGQPRRSLNPPQPCIIRVNPEGSVDALEQAIAPVMLAVCSVAVLCASDILCGPSWYAITEGQAVEMEAIEVAVAALAVWIVSLVFGVGVVRTAWRRRGVQSVLWSLVVALGAASLYWFELRDIVVSPSFLDSLSVGDDFLRL